MKYLTLGTVLAKVACHTGTIIVIYFIRASCIVFARIRVTIIDIWQIKKHVKHGKCSTRNRGYFCKVMVWFTSKKDSFHHRYRSLWVSFKANKRRSFTKKNFLLYLQVEWRDKWSNNLLWEQLLPSYPAIQVHV